jgi:HK97 family phage major capsid protein
MEKLLARIRELEAEMRKIADNLEASAEEVAKAEEMEAERDRLQAQVRMLRGLSSDDDDPTDAEDGASERSGCPPAAGSASVGEDRAGMQPFRSLGEQLLAVRDAQMARESGDGVVDQRLIYQARAAGANVAVPSEGGFGVQTDFATDLLRMAENQGALAPRCREYPVGPDSDSIQLPMVDETSRKDGYRWGGVTVGWVNEGGPISATKPAEARDRVELQKLAALYETTSEELRDSRTLTTMAMAAIPDEIAHEVDSAIWEGSGVGKPLGIISHPSMVTVAKESAQAAATIVRKNITKMFARLPLRMRPTAAWFVNQDAEPELWDVAWGDSRPAWYPAGSLANTPYSILMGLPVIPIEHASTLGTLGDFVLADLKEYALLKKASEGMRIDSSMHVRFVTDEMVFRFIFRVGGQPRWRTSLIPKKGTANVSPFIALATRA